MGNIINRRRVSGSKKSLLPSGYTQLEYIKSTSTQWIDIGYKPNINTRFEISGTQDDTDSALFGLSFVFYCFNNKSDNTYYNFFGDSNSNSFKFTMRGVPVILVMSATDGIIINGTKYVNHLTAGSRTANYTMTLFGRKNNNKDVVEKLGSHKINYAKIYENNILIHNYIPCRYDSDNVLGMFDTVSQTFFTNAGTGTFIPGPEV